MYLLRSWKWQHGQTLAITKIHQTKSACRSSSSCHCLNWNLVPKSHLVIYILAKKHCEEFSAPKQSRFLINFHKKKKKNAFNRSMNRGAGASQWGQSSPWRHYSMRPALIQTLTLWTHFISQLMGLWSVASHGSSWSLMFLRWMSANMQLKLCRTFALAAKRLLRAFCFKDILLVYHALLACVPILK